MQVTICIAANTLYYPNGGGHLWAYLNWALGFQSNGCRVIWLEKLDPAIPSIQSAQMIQALKSKIAVYGFSEMGLWYTGDEVLAGATLHGCLSINDVADVTDLIINQYYAMPFAVLSKFRRTALLDIDPGLLQMWWARKLIQVVPHDIYFTIGETVGQPEARFPGCGIRWNYTPPCVSLAHWPVVASSGNAPFTTITHWYMDLWEEDDGVLYKNDKRDGYIPYFELPRFTDSSLELALLFGPGDEEDEEKLLQNGWRICHSHDVAGTPEGYQQYIQQSRGEFSCVKPSCVRLQNAWISDRTICYLASGKPCIIENTGPSTFLPDAAGLFRFSNMQEAIDSIKEINADYGKQARLARSLAEEYFDAKKVTLRVLELAF